MINYISYYNKELFRVFINGNEEQLKEMVKLLIENGIEIQIDVYKEIYIDDDVKEYIKELNIKREVRENYYL